MCSVLAGPSEKGCKGRRNPYITPLAPIEKKIDQGGDRERGGEKKKKGRGKTEKKRGKVERKSQMKNPVFPLFSEFKFVMEKKRKKWRNGDKNGGEKREKKVKKVRRRTVINGGHLLPTPLYRGKIPGLSSIHHPSSAGCRKKKGRE